MKYYTTNSHPKLKHGCEIQLNGNMELPYILDIGTKIRLSEDLIINWLIKNWITDKEEKITGLSLKEIRKIVCEVTGVNENSVKVKTRERRIVKTRQFVHYFSNRLLNKSDKTIGKFTDSDRSTVINSCKVIRDLNKTHKEHYENYLKLKEVFQIDV